MPESVPSTALDATLQVALNNQFNFERYSSAVYLSLAAHLDMLNMVGMAGYLYKRAGEEESHAKRFREYIIDRNAELIVDALSRPDEIADLNPMTAGRVSFQAALDHEHKVTVRIEELSALAARLGDQRTREFLDFYLPEQVEEERTLEEIITKFSLAEGNGAAILMLDKELGS
jgi:ferritin